MRAIQSMKKFRKRRTMVADNFSGKYIRPGKDYMIHFRSNEQREYLYLSSLVFIMFARSTVYILIFNYYLFKPKFNLILAPFEHKKSIRFLMGDIS